MEDQINAVRARKPKKLPTVMGKEETLKVLGPMDTISEQFRSYLDMNP